MWLVIEVGFYRYPPGNEELGITRCGDNWADGAEAAQYAKINLKFWEAKNLPTDRALGQKKLVPVTESSAVLEPSDRLIGQGFYTSWSSFITHFFLLNVINNIWVFFKQIYIVYLQGSPEKRFKIS